MRLLNHTSKYLSLLLLPVITIWAVLFYYAMLDEIYDSLDDGLDNQKMLLVKRAETDPKILRHTDFNKHVYTFNKISKKKYDNFKESYHDTLMFMQNEQDFEPVRIYESTLMHNGAYYSLKVATSMIEEDDLLEDLITHLIGLYLVLVLSILILNNILLKRIWKPFYRLIDQLKNFRIEKSEPLVLHHTNIEEFKLLNHTVQRLTQKSSESFIAQKQFIENASHELQTPLAISINKLELLLENKDITENQLNDIAVVLENLGRLTRMNKSLLLLSKIENLQFKDEHLVDFKMLTEKIIYDFDDFIAHRKMNIVVAQSENLTYKINEDIAAILLTNLIKNAVFHGKPSTQIKIDITKNSWEIMSYGELEPLDESKIFARFVKVTTQKKSTGLGLAIAKAITDKYALTLKYRYDSSHIFKIEVS